MAAVVERHGQDLVARSEQRHERGHVRLGSAVGLNVGPLGAEQLLRAITGEILHLVDVLAPAVITAAWIALRVLVRERGAHRRHDLLRGMVLGGDQLQLCLLALLLTVDGGPDCVVGVEGGVRPGKRIGHRLQGATRRSARSLVPGRPHPQRAGRSPGQVPTRITSTATISPNDARRSGRTRGTGPATPCPPEWAPWSRRVPRLARARHRPAGPPCGPPDTPR